MTNLFIPTRIRVGFQKRDDTFTGKLAYIIFYDAQGNIKQEKGWEKWRDKNIDYVEFDNVPQSNYILNKGVQRSGHWNSGRSMIRVYDPRDFEFEISIDNLIGILMHSDVNKRDIAEQCVFAWSGNNVILIPTNSDDYQKGLAFTSKQDKVIESKDLVEGHSYIHKKDDKTYTYIGHYNYFEKQYWNRKIIPKGKQRVFFDGKEYVMLTADKLSECVSSELNQNFATLVEKFFESVNGQDIGKFTYGVPKNNKTYFFKKSNGEIHKISFKVADDKVNIGSIIFKSCSEVQQKNTILECEDQYYMRHYFRSEEGGKIQSYCKEEKIHPNEMPIEKFIEMLKKLDYKTAYYVGADKNKVEI